MAIEISVIIPAYNRGNVIGAAIESALAQLGGEAKTMGDACELIVADDGSTDNLVAALRPFMSRLRLIRHDTNAGAAAARNTAVEVARGEYLAFLDSDDIWLSDKLSRQLSAMRRHGWQASCTSYVLVRPDVGELVSPAYRTGPLGIDELIWGCFVSVGSTLMCRRTLFAEVGPFDAGLRRLEDWDWLLRLARSRPLGFLAEPLARIEPAPGPNAAKVGPAVDRLWEKHAPHLSGKLRRRFAAALDIERAAAFYRFGHRIGAAGYIARSLLRVPIGNGALAAVRHNRRPQPDPLSQQMM